MSRGESDRRACIRVIPEANLSQGTFRPVVEPDLHTSIAIEPAGAVCVEI